jgi:nitroreductase/NAD-dependent dihydropyrimidine dehydrogenase PreA subunit
MGLITIDEGKCKKDGLCAGECPMAIIRMAEGEFPVLVDGGDMMCNDCGHCVAVCPHDALAHERVPVDASPKIEKDLKINEAQMVQFLRSRRSIRRFEDQPVEKEKIERLIEIARYAPTGNNGQLIEWQVFTDTEAIKGLTSLVVDFLRSIIKDMGGHSYAGVMSMIVGAWDMGYDAVLWSAPAVVLASAPKTALSGEQDVASVLTYFQLAATTMGLGTCWAGMMQNALKGSPELKAAVHLPVGHIYHYPMMLGYPKPKYFRMPERRSPKINWW